GGTASGIVNGHLLMAGGRTNPDATLDLTWDYNIATDSWTQKASRPVAENVPGSVVANGELWSIGGGEPFTPFTTTGVVSYNPTTDTWAPQPALNAQRSFTAASLVGNRIIAAGGRDGAATSLSSVERLTLSGGGGCTTEGFDDITNLPDWFMINHSEPLGVTDWFQGNDAVFPSHSGDPTSYIAANFNNG